MSALYALILAGGRGARFWPLSRKDRPKQCLSLDGGPSFLQRTVARVSPLIPPERVLVVTGPDMADLVRQQLPDLPAANIIVEPSPRNTAPSIALGAVEVARRGGGSAVMAVLPADHEVGAEAELRSVLSAAAACARQTNALITIGVRPTRAETGFGYLAPGSFVGRWESHELRMVERFIEKPPAAVAERLFREGSALWNAGIFVFGVDALRDAFRVHLPGVAEAIEELQRRPDRIAELWEGMEATSIDYGVLEHSRHLFTVPCELGWSDVGTWESAAALLPVVEGGRGLARAVVARESQGNVVYAPNKAVALLGVRDLVVVDTPDAILVMDRAHGQALRLLLDRLPLVGLDDLT
jgi:mannose-1-phosphate guanylyltransferase